MQTASELFLNLIKQGFHSESDESKIDIPNEYVNSVLELASKHSILPIIYSEIRKNVDEKYIDARFKDESQITCIKQMVKTKAFLDTYRKLMLEGIKPVVVKGIVCRDLYGKYSNHRPSCDEDIYISVFEYEKTVDVLTQAGYICADGVVDYEEVASNDQEVTFFNPRTQLMLEIHFNLIGKHDEFHSKLNDLFVHDEMRVVDMCLQTEGNASIVSLDYTDHFLFLIIHAYKHFVQKGLGIRQILDMCLYEERYKDRIDYDVVTDKLQSRNVMKFWNDIKAIGYWELGFNNGEVNKSDTYADLLNDILMEGTFGGSTQAQRTAQPLVSMLTKNNNLIYAAFKTIFPNRSDIFNEFPELEEMKYGLFKGYCARWKKYMSHSKEEKHLARESIKLATKRMKLLKHYDMV